VDQKTGVRLNLKAALRTRWAKNWESLRISEILT